MLMLSNANASVIQGLITLKGFSPWATIETFGLGEGAYKNFSDFETFGIFEMLDIQGLIAQKGLKMKANAKQC